MKLKLQLTNLLFLGLCLSFIMACNNSEGDKTQTKGKKTLGELQEAKGGKYYGKVFSINETEYFRTLYPLNIGEVGGHRIGNQIYEGLVRLDQSDLSIQPAVAEQWTISEDALTYTFNLRKGVRFHDDACFADGKGRTVTAKDFKYCLDRLCSYDSNNKGYEFVKGRIVGADKHHKLTKNKQATPNGVDGVTIIDDYTLEVKLERPFSSFLYILGMPFGYVFPKEAVDKYGVDMRAKAVGTGPFYLKTVKENEAVILLRNDHYWGKDADGNQLPYLDGIRFKFIGDQMAELLEFKQNKLDMVYRLPLQLSDEIVDRQGNLLGEYQKYQYQEKGSMTIQYYGFLNTGKMFSNKKLRQAFCYAIDRQKIVDFTVKGAGTPGIHGIVPPAFAAYDAKSIKGYSFDANKARTLLAEAGYPDGKGLGEITLQINSGGTRNEQIAEAVQKMLKENLNATVNITKMPFAQHLENVEAAKVGFWRAGWIADYPDPENFLTLLWGNHLPTDPTQSTYLNTFRYKNATYDQFFEQALKTVEETERNALFLKAEQQAIDDAALLPIYYSKDQRLLQSNVRNFPQNAMEYRNLRDVYFVPDNG